MVKSFWLIIVILFLILIGVIIFWVSWGTKTGQLSTVPPAEESYQQRTAPIIISELEGIQSLIEADFEENGAYLIKVAPVKVFSLRSEIPGLSGYDENRLKGANSKDFLYQSDEAGSKYALFAVLPDGSSQIKKTDLAGFPFPDGGYNFYFTVK